MNKNTIEYAIKSAHKFSRYMNYFVLWGTLLSVGLIYLLLIEFHR